MASRRAERVAHWCAPDRKCSRLFHSHVPPATALPHDPDLLPNVDIDEHHVFGTRRTFLDIGRRKLAVGAAAICLMSLGINELPAAATTVQAEKFEASLQSFSTGSVSAPTIERSGYDVSTFTVVQWPINPATAISDYFGSRVAPCASCSTYHLGIDWDAPSGSSVGAIADGTVVGLDNISGDLGVHVVIEHEINGEIVRSVYAHLLSGSVPLSVGATVSRGDAVGQVGNTGLSTGAHLHFAMIDVDGTFFDPLTWLESRVNVEWGE